MSDITDYLQLAWAGNAQSMFDRITEVSHVVRGAAEEFGLVSIGVSQFNRQTSTSGEKPTIQGVAGGSSLENDSNQVVLLDHTTYKQTGKTTAIMKLDLAKNRHGPIGTIPVMWNYRNLRATECDEREFEEGT